MPQASSIDTITLPSDQDASGRTLGSEEKDLLAEVINSGTLTSTKGQFVKQLETDFAGLTGSKHALACASGTAAIHCAVVAIDCKQLLGRGLRRCVAASNHPSYG